MQITGPQLLPFISLSAQLALFTKLTRFICLIWTLFSHKLVKKKKKGISHLVPSNLPCVLVHDEVSAAAAITARIMIKPAVQRRGAPHISPVDTSATAEDWVPDAELLPPGTRSVPRYFSPAVSSSNKRGTKWRKGAAAEGGWSISHWCNIAYKSNLITQCGDRL